MPHNPSVPPARSVFATLFDAVPIILTIALVGVAIMIGRPAVDGVRWFGDADFRRDVGIAQSIRDGNPFADPAYRGMPFWFSPLFPAIVAAISWLSGSPVSLVHSQVGPVLTVLAPLCFAILVGCYGGRWTALAAVTGYLFVVTRDTPSWAAATYSPIPYAETFVQSFFYLALTAYWYAVRQGKGPWFMATGALFGLLIVGRVAPSIVFLAVILADTIRRLSREPDDRNPILQQFAALAGTAAFVASPYLLSMIGYYRLDVVNDTASRWLGEMVALDRLDLLIGHVFGPLTLVALVGVAAVYRCHRSETAPLLIWGVVSLGSTVYGELWQAAAPFGLPLSPIVPPHHFLFYLKAAESALFGFGAVAIATAATRRSPVWANVGRTVAARAALIAGLALAVLWTWPATAEREDFRRAPEVAPADQAIIEWLRDNTEPADVVLTSSHNGLFLVAPAGRKVVLLPKLFSNPFVDWEVRDAERARLVDAFVTGDGPAFTALARQSGIGWMLWAAETPLPERAGGAVEAAFTAGPTTVLRVR